MKLGLILAGQYLRDAPAAQRAGEMLEQVRLARDLGETILPKLRG